MDLIIPKGKYRYILLVLMIFLLTVPVSARTYGDRFADVPADAWYHGYVSAAYEMGIIDGTDETHYQPDGYVTLAECIKLASCIHQLRTEGEVSLTNGTEIWYETYVQYALDNGILEVPFDDYTTPADRAQTVVIFTAVLPEDEPVINPPGTLGFRDVTDETAWYYGDVYRMYGCGIMVGDDTYRFCPDEPILRSEMAAVTVRMLDGDTRVTRPITAPAQVECAVLMYHNFAEQSADYTVTPMTFRSHLRALKEAGYESISFRELILYTEGKIPLPEKCVLLTSDDGYSGVLDIALPLLREFDMQMSVAVIGNLIGTGADGSLSHFTMDDIKKADGEGRIEVISHSWGLHTNGSYLDGAVNLAMTEADYTAYLAADRDKLLAAVGADFPMAEKVFVYPFGKYSAASEAWLASVGCKVSVTVDRGISHISVGDSLYLLKRIPAEWYTTGEALLRNMK